MKNKIPYGATVFFLSFFCFFIAVMPVMISGNGLFTFYSDYNKQDLEFMSNIHYALRNGGLGWDWFTDLGSAHLESYSYYGLGSPFFWIMMILPEKLLLPAMPVMLCIKTATASLTAYLFIRRFSCTKEAAAVGGVLYGFSGFALYNVIFYHFHDAIALFPLLLLTVEMAVSDGKKGVFAIVTALCACVNFYFFFGQVLFVLIYIAIRATDKSFSLNIKKFGFLAAEAVIGTLMAGVILYPGFVAVSSSGRAGETIALSDFFLYDGIGFYFRYLQQLIMSPDPCLVSNLIETPKYKFGSLAMYLPVFSVVFAASYIRRNKKSWETKLILLSLIISLVPVLNSAFSLFNSNYYARWLYMPLLVICLMTSKVIDNPDKHPIKSSFAVVTGLFLAYSAYLIITFDKVDTLLAVAQFASSAVMYIMLAIVVFRLKRDKLFQLNCVSFAAVGAIILSCSFVWSSLSLDMHRELITRNYKPQTMDDYRSESFERVELIDAYSNFNMFWHLPSSKSYISLCNDSIAELYEVLDEEYSVGGSYNSSAYPLRGLFSIRYVIDDVTPTDSSLTDKTGELTGFMGCTYKGTAGDFYIYENRHFVPMGFTYDSYCTYEDLEMINGIELRSMLLLEAVLLTAEQEEAYAGNMHRFDISQLEYSTDRYYELCKERAAQSCDSFEASSNGFSAHITLDEQRLVFFSVPYDDGFTAYVNGAKVGIEKVSGGLMAIPCQVGDNEIEVVYRSQSFMTGLAISASGFVLYVLYLALCTKKKKQQ